MRHDHRPSWMRRTYTRYEAWWTRRFLAPQFDAFGGHAVIVRPWYVDVFGAGISAGAHLHALASSDMHIRLTTWPPPDTRATLTLGDAVLLTGGVRMTAAKNITIGDGCMFAANATITDCDWHGLYDRVEAGRNAHPVTLGQNVWIGDGAFVGKGVSIGDHTIVAARAVVVKDLPPRVVAAGNPAQIVKHLDEDTPFRTRMDLFADVELEPFVENAWRERNGQATTLNWLRTKIAPQRDD